MRAFIIFSFLLTFLVTAKAQKFSINVYGDAKFLDDDVMINSNGENNSLIKTEGYIIECGQTNVSFKLAKAPKLSTNKFNIILSEYDSSMNLIKQSQLSNGEKKYGPFSSVLKKIDDKVYLIYYIYNNAEDENSPIKIMASEVDPSSLSLLPPKELLSFNQENTKGFDEMNMLLNKLLIISQSPDNKKLLILFSPQLNNKFFFSVLDNNLNLIYTKPQEITASKDVRVNSACVDNNGSVYIGYQAEESKNNYPAYVMFCNQTTPANNYKIEITPGHYPEISMVLAAKNENTVYVAGTYSKTDHYQTKFNPIDGTYFATINTSTGKIGGIKENMYPENMSQLYKNVDSKIYHRGYTGDFFTTYKIFELDNGSIDIVAELKGHNIFTNGPYGGHIYDIGGTIINIKFSTTGDALFARIPKLRITESGTPIGIPYFAFPYKNDMIIIYNDHDKNLEKDMSDNPSIADDLRNSVLVAATINEDGTTVKREKILDLSDDKFIAMPELMIMQSPTSLLIPCQKYFGQMGVKEEMKWASININ